MLPSDASWHTRDVDEHATTALPIYNSMDIIIINNSNSSSSSIRRRLSSSFSAASTTSCYTAQGDDVVTVAPPRSCIRRKIPFRECPSKIIDSFGGNTSCTATTTTAAAAAISSDGMMDATLPGSIERIPRPKSIGFDQRVSVRMIIPAKDLSLDPESLWFQEEELQLIAAKTVALIRHVGRAGDSPSPSKKYCLRGLEKYINPGATQMKRHKARGSVLDEQSLQRQQDIVNPEQLAAMYKLQTLPCRMEACKRASQDARDVAAYLTSTKRAVYQQHDNGSC
jgi:hypothetical protein